MQKNLSRFFVFLLFTGMVILPAFNTAQLKAQPRHRRYRETRKRPVRRHRRRVAHRINCKKAKIAIRRTRRLIRRAIPLIKKGKRGRKLLIRAVRHQRVARRIVRRRGMCHRAFLHTIRARRLAIAALKKGKIAVKPDEKESSEEKELVGNEDLEKLDKDAETKKFEIPDNDDALNELMK